MKNLILIISIVATGCCSTTKVLGQPITAATDTLLWLKTNIEQRNSYYSGKPLSVLLDTLSKRGLYNGTSQYTSPLNSDGASAETRAGDTVYTADFKIYFGNQYYGGGIVEQMHEANPSVNTHLKWIYLTFTKKIPFPSRIVFDKNIGDIFGPV